MQPLRASIIRSYSNSIGNFSVRGGRRITGIDFRINLALIADKAPPAWTGLEGQGEAAGVIGLGGDELIVMTGIGAHYSTNGKIEYQMGVWAPYEVCALPPPVGSTLVRSWLPDARTLD